MPRDYKRFNVTFDLKSTVASVPYSANTLIEVITGSSCNYDQSMSQSLMIGTVRPYSYKTAASYIAGFNTPYYELGNIDINYPSNDYVTVRLSVSTGGLANGFPAYVLKLRFKPIKD